MDFVGTSLEEGYPDPREGGGEGRDGCEIKAWRFHRGKWGVSDGAFSTQGPEEMRPQKCKSDTETGKPLQPEIKTPGELEELAGKSANCAEIWLIWGVSGIQHQCFPRGMDL